MEDTPKGLRTHIALFGRRNAGKSSLLNALAGQTVAIVSEKPGTTTDPVEKTMELQPLGPVVLVDTAGIDDEEGLGPRRVERSLQILRRADAALLLTEGGTWGEAEDSLARKLVQAGVPFAVAASKADLPGFVLRRPAGLPEDVPVIAVSARTGEGLDAVRGALAALLPEAGLPEPPLLSDLLPETGLALLVVPIDSGAPKGRLILPQVQAIRDLLDGRRLCLVTTEADLPAALQALKEPPSLVVCDSQVVRTADRLTPPEIPLTTFSILMARFKADLVPLARGAAALRHLRPGDRVCIQEACSHHPQKDDIGRVKLPRLLAKLAGGPLDTVMSAGKEMSDFPEGCRAVVHCGACVITRAQMLARLREARRRGIPMTNYGMAISLAQGVLLRTLSPFPEALRAFSEGLAGPDPAQALENAAKPR